VRHVVSETARTREAAAALGRRDLERFGALLFQSHVSMRDAYQASCRTADILVEAASRHGAYGARLTGAGWGGAVIALLPESRATPIAIAMSEDFERATGRAPVVWWTRAGGGVRRVLSAE
jgi:galactokinase